MLEAVFAPRSVAVVGASPDERKLGHTVFRNIVQNGYTGALYPIHPKADEILGYRAYPSISAHTRRSLRLPSSPILNAV